MTAIVGRHVDTGLRSLRRRIRSASYLRKWLILAAGIVVNGARCHHPSTPPWNWPLTSSWASSPATRPRPRGRGRGPITDALRPWAIPFVVGLGGVGRAHFPSCVATIVAYSIFGAVEGLSPIFGTQALYGFANPVQLGWHAMIGSVCGLVGLLYIRGFYGPSSASRSAAAR